MSDINPMTGAPNNPSPPPQIVQEASKPRSVFPDPIAEKLDQEMNSEEAQAYADLAFQAANTKFATGDRDTDIRNLLQFKKNIAGLLSFLNG